MKKKHLVSGLAILGAGAAAAAAVVAAKKLAKENTEPEDSILLDLDGDGVADVVLEDLDGDGKIDTVTAGVQPETKAPEEPEKVEEAPAPEAVETESVSSIRSLPYNVFSKSTSSFSIRFCSFTMALSVGQYCDKVRFCRLVVL